MYYFRNNLGWDDLKIADKRRVKVMHVFTCTPYKDNCHMQVLWVSIYKQQLLYFLHRRGDAFKLLSRM